MTEIEETWSPEPVKAWRYWRVTPLEWNWSAHRFEVSLIGDHEVWDGPVKYAGQHQGQIHTAVDGHYELMLVDHPAPHTGCLCGVNAVKELDWVELRRRTSNQWIGPNEIAEVPVAVAPVELAGIVDEYEEGYRAEQATIVGPIRLFNGDSKQARALETVYGIEVIVEDWYSDWSQNLHWTSEVRRLERGHREADTSDHRGTGTGQDTGTGEGTGKGRKALEEVGLLFAAFAITLGLALFIGLFITGAIELFDGSEQDAECVRVAQLTGGVAEELGTFGQCRVVLPSGLIVNSDNFQWVDEAD